MAKQQVQLTGKDSNEVYWEDVDVSKGVYAKWNGDTLYMIDANSGLYLVDTHANKQSATKENLSLLIDYLHNDIQLYTIPDNRRITTTKSLTVDDLKDTDHVSVIFANGEKGYASQSDMKFKLINPYSESAVYCNCTNFVKGQSIIELITNAVTAGQIILANTHDTRKELYQWLAED